MATFTALKPVNMNGVPMFEVVEHSYAPAQVNAYGAGGEAWKLLGSFVISTDYYENTYLGGGTVASAIYSQAGSAVFRLDVPVAAGKLATTTYGYVTAKNAPSLFGYLLSGNDTLTGSTGNDQLNGYAGADALKGKGGKDTLTGGAGADKFVFDSAAASTSTDTIKDFNRGQNDTIVLDDDFFNAGPLGTLAGARFSHGMDMDRTTVVGAGVRIIYDDDSGRLYYDPNGGSGTGRVLIATLTAGPELLADDFQIRG
jgi:Ca2+-binding RTX toxin-like protein